MLWFLSSKKGWKSRQLQVDADVLPQEGTSGKQRSICSASAKRSNTSSTCLGCVGQDKTLQQSPGILGDVSSWHPKSLQLIQTKSTTETRFKTILYGTIESMIFWAIIEWSEPYHIESWFAILWCHWSTTMIILDFFKHWNHKPLPCPQRHLWITPHSAPGCPGLHLPVTSQLRAISSTSESLGTGVVQKERGTLCARVIFTKNTTFQKVH